MSSVDAFFDGSKSFYANNCVTGARAQSAGFIWHYHSTTIFTQKGCPEADRQSFLTLLYMVFERKSHRDREGKR